jgi:hypothetical protein
LKESQTTPNLDDVMNNSTPFKNRSDLRTKLKRAGLKVGRRFRGDGMIAKYNGRRFRFRLCSAIPIVDISCVEKDWDRWANSTELLCTPEWLHAWLQVSQQYRAAALESAIFEHLSTNKMQADSGNIFYTFNSKGN